MSAVRARKERGIEVASGFGLSNKGKHNSAGEELQDIDWDNLPAEQKKTGWGMQPSKPTTPPPATEEEWLESQLVEGEVSQLPPSEAKAGKESAASSGGEEQDMGADVGTAQVKTGSKKTADPTGGVRVKKQPLPGKR